jgi:endoglucanase
VLNPLPLFSWLAAAAFADSSAVIRVNQVGYLPDAPKVAVVCSTLSNISPRPMRFELRDDASRVRYSGSASPGGAFGPCTATWRLDFTKLRRPGRYVIEADGVRSPTVRIAENVFAGGADTALQYMREQRSGWNPFFRDSVHKRDGFVIDDSGHVVKFHPASGGWADASDYLQYVATSATATYHMLSAYRDHRAAFQTGVLDEANHGIEWLLRMFPNDTEMYNQLGDDRDHMYFDLPTSDSSDYGWGKGKERPIYPCTGRPQGILRYKNRSTGYASTAGKYASAFALASRILGAKNDSLARLLRRRAEAAYALGKKYPGVCQTAPGTSPYFYEEENWVDDMELGAAELYGLTHDARYLSDARDYASREPVTPWMGADTARHYEWYPWYNAGHFALYRFGGAREKKLAAEYYKRGVEAVIKRANNSFRIGVPFIWCSNDLVVSFAVQAGLYRRMTGDNQFREYEQAAIDWIFGANPWGTSMVVGYPRGGTWPRDPHSAVAPQFGPEALTGGLVDGPVYRSIFSNLRGIALRHADSFAAYNTGFIVYHDDLGDYSTNEPIMDGTANLIYLLASLSK